LAYKSVLEHARKHTTYIKLHAGFMPWPMACVAIRKVSGTLGIKQALRMAHAR
jgi:hypothetical protein